MHALIYVIAGLVIGVVAGLKLNIGYNPAFGVYISLVVLSIINTIFNLMNDNLKKEINMLKSGLLLVADLAFALLLGYIGEQLGLPIYLAAIFAFGNNIYNNIKNPLKVTRYHSLSIEEKNLDSQFTITSRLKDGTVMSIENRDKMIYGVQYHPEAILTEQGMDLLRNFLRINNGKTNKNNK